MRLHLPQRGEILDRHAFVPRRLLLLRGDTWSDPHQSARDLSTKIEGSLLSPTVSQILEQVYLLQSSPLRHRATLGRSWPKLHRAPREQVIPQVLRCQIARDAKKIEQGATLHIRLAKGSLEASVEKRVD